MKSMITLVLFVLSSAGISHSESDRSPPEKSLGVAGSGDPSNFGSNGSGGAVRPGSRAKGSNKPSYGVADVTPRDPKVSPGLTKQEVMAVIRAHLNELRHCYEDTLPREPKATGRVNMEFVIGLNSTVSSVKELSSSINDEVFLGCFKRKIKKWEFPRPRERKPVTVEYEFIFNPL